jgi:hypothetical protein
VRGQRRSCAPGSRGAGALPGPRLEALEYLASADAVEGGHVHNPIVAALGLVKADLIRLGIGNMAPAE